MHPKNTQSQIATGSAGWPLRFRFAVHVIWSRVPELLSLTILMRSQFIAVASLVVLGALFSAGCIPIPKGTWSNYTSRHHFSRTNSLGETNEFIAVTQTEHKSFLIVAPHGPELDYPWLTTTRYHLHGVDPKPIELSFLTSHRQSSWSIYPVQDTDLWVALGNSDMVRDTDETKTKNYKEGYAMDRALVFGPRHVLHDIVITVNMIPYASRVLGFFSNQEARFDALRRHVLFKDKSGWQSLDVVTGQISTIPAP